MRLRNKKGQFYLIAAIIIGAIVIGISYLINYSTKIVSYEAEEIAQELNIEAEHVLDYELKNPGTLTEEFEDFSAEYSGYAKDKDIYFIVVDTNPPTPIEEAYKYTEGIKVYFNDRLYVNPGSETIEFSLDNKFYIFPLEEGKNFYFLVIYDKRGERYVYTG